MNTHKYLKPYAIVPVTMDAIRDLVELGKQQADRIVELEKQYDAMVMSFEARLATRGYEIQIKDQQDRIAELEKQSEPVAWIYQDHDTLQPALKFANPTKYWATVISTPDIPLYTTPQIKPLSDEEIMDIAEQSDYSPLEIEMGYDYEIRIARAIEERHGIK